MEGRTSCDSCAFQMFDEEYETYACQVNLDEDEYVKVMTGAFQCPYYRYDDEYKIVRKQM